MLFTVLRIYIPQIMNGLYYKGLSFILLQEHNNIIPTEKKTMQIYLILYNLKTLRHTHLFPVRMQNGTNTLKDS